MHTAVAHAPTQQRSANDSSGRAAVCRGYILGGILWFAVPYTLSTCLGLGALALDLPLSTTEVGKGLVPPAIAYHLFGNGARLACVNLVRFVYACTRRLSNVVGVMPEALCDEAITMCSKFPVSMTASQLAFSYTYSFRVLFRRRRHPHHHHRLYGGHFLWVR